MIEKKSPEHRAPFDRVADRFCHSLADSIENLRKGEDSSALVEFTGMLQELELLTEMDQYPLEERLELKRVIPVLEEIFCHLRNRDITALTDTLEFSLYPIAKELAEDYGNDNSQRE